MDTAELRDRFLVPELFVDDEVRSTYTHHDASWVTRSPPTVAP